MEKYAKERLRNEYPSHLESLACTRYALFRLKHSLNSLFKEFPEVEKRFLELTEKYQDKNTTDFYCKSCDYVFSIKEEGYINYKCPKCGEFCQQKDKNLPCVVWKCNPGTAARKKYNN